MIPCYGDPRARWRGHIEVGRGTVYLRDGDEVHVYEIIQGDFPVTDITPNDNCSDGAELWFESADELSH